MSKKLNLTGQPFGRATVISEAEPFISPSGYKKIRWNCLCNCGNKFVARTGDLRSGNTKSCGCLNIEKIIKRNAKHDKSQAPIYTIWLNMKNRCLNPNNERYKDYGSRGITVCDRWLESFENFYKDMGDPPEGMSLDRIDNDKGYSPDNCKWSTQTQQNINKRMQKNNTSGIKGVYWDEEASKWRAGIVINSRSIYLGRFVDKEDAIAARKAAEEKYHKPILES